MKSFVNTFLLALYLAPSSASSVHRQLDDDRHSDPPDQHNAPNPPALPNHSYRPSSMPTIMKSKTPSVSPSKKISKAPSLSPTIAQSSSPSETPTVQCNSDADGSFGETTAEGSTLQVDIPYNYQMEINEDYNNDHTVLEREITSIIARSLNPECSSGSTNSLTRTSIVGISTGNIDEPVEDCIAGNNESTDCFVMQGGVSVYVEDRRRSLADSLGFNQAVIIPVRAIIKSGMDTGVIANNVDGITGLTWVPENVNDVYIGPLGQENAEEDGEFVTIGASLLGGLGFILVGGYGLTKYKERKNKAQQRASEGSDGDENFVEIA